MGRVKKGLELPPREVLEYWKINLMGVSGQNSENQAQVLSVGNKHSIGRET